ncbi:13318_t:CDS:2, partial [Gigaspora rosea]
HNRANVDVNAGVNVNANMDANVGACVGANVDTNVNADINIVTDVHNCVNIDANVDANIDANLDINANAATDFFDTFLKTMKNDYEHCGPQLRAALEKLAKRYNAAKAKSIPVLIFFLYNMNHNSDPLGRVKSSAKIRVQVESVKCRKTESSVKKSGDKENRDHDPYVIPARKVRAI